MSSFPAKDSTAAPAGAGGGGSGAAADNMPFKLQVRAEKLSDTGSQMVLEISGGNLSTISAFLVEKLGEAAQIKKEHLKGWFAEHARLFRLAEATDSTPDKPETIHVSFLGTFNHLTLIAIANNLIPVIEAEVGKLLPAPSVTDESPASSLKSSSESAPSAVYSIAPIPLSSLSISESVTLLPSDMPTLPLNSLTPVLEKFLEVTKNIQAAYTKTSEAVAKKVGDFYTPSGVAILPAVHRGSAALAFSPKHTPTEGGASGSPASTAETDKERTARMRSEALARKAAEKEAAEAAKAAARDAYRRFGEGDGPSYGGK